VQIISQFIDFHIKKRQTNFDDPVKIPSVPLGAELRFTFVVAAHLASALPSSNFTRLVYEVSTRSSKMTTHQFDIASKFSLSNPPDSLSDRRSFFKGGGGVILA
jgi:hypothetical protein